MGQKSMTQKEFADAVFGTLRGFIARDKILQCTVEGKNGGNIYKVKIRRKRAKQLGIPAEITSHRPGDILEVFHAKKQEGRM